MMENEARRVTPGGAYERKNLNIYRKKQPD